MASITFSLDGHILSANENFLEFMGYQLNEIQGWHHRIFMPAEERTTAAYQEFWRSLGTGESTTGEFRRIAQDGRPVFIRGIYNPILYQNGKVTKILKLAYNITESKTLEQEMEGQLAAINNMMATIEFDPQGNILSANDNFLELMGYELAEITGWHHLMFVQEKEAQSQAYEELWQNLAAGQNSAGDFKRLTRDGYEVYIRGIYNPIKDQNGTTREVLKLAYDITGSMLPKA